MENRQTGSQTCPDSPSRGWRDRDPAPVRATDTADGAANARLLERCRPGGPSEGAGSGGEDRALVKVLDGLRAKKTQRQIAEDIFGADGPMASVAAATPAEQPDKACRPKQR